jgi:hypothetical protein
MSTTGFDIETLRALRYKLDIMVWIWMFLGWGKVVKSTEEAANHNPQSTFSVIRKFSGYSLPSTVGQISRCR